MVKNKLNYIFTSILIIAIAVGLIVSLSWNATTALFPRIVGIPALCLCIAVLATSIRRGREEGRQERSEKAKKADSEFTKSLKTAAVLFSWIIGFIILIWAIGINIAIPVYVFTYMKVQGKYGWLMSAITAAGVGAFIFLVFNVIFHIVWPDSLIQRFL